MTGERNRTAVDFEAYGYFGEEMIEQTGKNPSDYADSLPLRQCQGRRKQSTDNQNSIVRLP